MNKEDLTRTISTLEKHLAERYEQLSIGHRTCFRLTDGSIIALDSISCFHAVVVEYAKDLSDANKNLFEDGDPFPIHQYSEDALLKSILAEIEAT